MGLVVNVTLRPLYPMERPGTHCIRSWVSLIACLDRCGKSRPRRDSTPGLSSPLVSKIVRPGIKSTYTEGWYTYTEIYGKYYKKIYGFFFFFFFFQSTKPPGTELKNLQSPIVPPTPLFSFSLLATCAEYSPLRHQPHPLHCNFSRQIRDKTCNTLCEFSDGNGVKWRDPWEFSLFLFVPFFFFLTLFVYSIKIYIC